MATLGVLYGGRGLTERSSLRSFRAGAFIGWSGRMTMPPPRCAQFFEQSGPVDYWCDFIRTEAPAKLSAVTTFSDSRVGHARPAGAGTGGTSVEAARLLTDKFRQGSGWPPLAWKKPPCLPVTVPAELSGALDSIGLPA